MYELDETNLPIIIPAIATKEIVVFPGTEVHFEVTDERSLNAVRSAYESNRAILMIYLEKDEREEPITTDLAKHGTIAMIKQILESDKKSLRIHIIGAERVEMKAIYRTKPCILCEVMAKDFQFKKLKRGEVAEGTIRRVKETFKQYSNLLNRRNSELVASVENRSNPMLIMSDIITASPFKIEEKQRILDIDDIKKALEELCILMENEIMVLNIEEEINQRLRAKIDENQQEYYMKEKYKILQKELYGKNRDSEMEDIEKNIMAIKNISDSSREHLLFELDRYKEMAQNSADAATLSGYFKTILSLPFDKSTKDNLNNKALQKQLDKDHYGMQKVKERILELLAVRQLNPDVKGQIICLAGPPGVGKTSISESIARSLGRNFQRIALGGTRDESEIRGHRKTYIGAVPGRIINALQKSKSSNPLILLDEIDKLGGDYKGDPSSALLEVLDPEQNSTFVDNYVQIPFDLSKVLFIATANYVGSIPAPLLDRMEVIELSSYTRDEKFQISKKHLIKKQVKENGLTTKNIAFKDDAIYSMLDSYTREAGVRRLERTIAKVCRKVAKEVVDGSEVKSIIKENNIKDYLGVVKYNTDIMDDIDQLGVVNGLAWTSVGGELLPIEVAVMKGDGKLKLTGSLGKVMQESAQIAVSYIRTIADKYDIDPMFYKNTDIHIHAPDGAVPKDGPSAGVTMTTALVSALSGRKAKANVAMTGEITLTGRVTAIGGLREKSTAAYKHQKAMVIIPRQNLKDLEEIDQAILDGLEFKPVDHISEVLELALCKPTKTKKKTKKSTKDKEYNVQPTDVVGTSEGAECEL